MLSLATGINKTGRDFAQEDLYLTLRGAIQYDRHGKRGSLLDLCGIEVPEDSGVIASIRFFKRSGIAYPYEFVRCRHEKMGAVYAPVDELEEARLRMDRYIRNLEEQTLDTPTRCPGLLFVHTHPLTVSVKRLGAYFNLFNHHPQTSLADNYHSDRERIAYGDEAAMEQGPLGTIVFITGEGVVRSLVPHKID
ncbi:MAG: hypothetical protein ACE5DM_02235 [Candidatus Nanoarchaeia archaeon]